MKNDFIIFNGLYGDNTYSPILDFLHHEPLESRSKMYNWEIKEHLHTDLVQVFIIELGDGILVSEKKEMIISGPSVVVIPPNTLHGFVFQNNTVGDVFTFAERYFDAVLKFVSNGNFTFNSLTSLSFETEKSTFKRIVSFKNMIIEELSEDLVEKQPSIQCLFQMIFVWIFRFSFKQKREFTATDNRTLKYLQAFQKDIKQNIFSSKTISQYAKDLNITTVHLNRICKSVFNKAPIQIIHEQLIFEAKKYLLNTNYSVSEISYFLNFNDPAYFTRFFKKMMGVSPSEFRKS